jgi:DNA-binding XRE family transcriptional regulator
MELPGVEARSERSNNFFSDIILIPQKGLTFTIDMVNLDEYSSSMAGTRREDLLTPFIDSIVRTRQKNKLTQVDLSRRAGVSLRYITMVENGWRLPTLDTALFLCAAVGMPKQEVSNLVEDFLDQLRWM